MIYMDVRPLSPPTLASLAGVLVRGHEKVPVCGRIWVPAGGRLEVPIPRFDVSAGFVNPRR